MSKSVYTSTVTREGKPSIDTAAYANGDLVGDGPVEMEAASRDSGLGGVIQSAVLVDDAKQSQIIEAWVFDEEPTETTFTDNDPWDPAEADLEHLVGVLTFETFVEGANRSAASLAYAGLAFRTESGRSLWVVLVSRGTPTYASADDLTIRLGILQD